jgi:hypothetical protein
MDIFPFGGGPGNQPTRRPDRRSGSCHAAVEFTVVPRGGMEPGSLTGSLAGNLTAKIASWLPVPGDSRILR